MAVFDRLTLTGNRDRGHLELKPMASPPVDNPGGMYFGDDGDLYIHDGSAWRSVGGASSAVSVMGYGAVGDGTTDDTTAIRAAITAAGVNGVLSWPRNRTFVVSDELKPLAGQTWLMDGVTLTIPNESAGDFTTNDTYIQGSGALNDVRAIIAINAVDGVTIQGVTIDGNGDNQNGANIVRFAGILVHDAERVVIDRCTVSDIIYHGNATDDSTRQFGLVFSKSRSCEVRGGYYSHCGYENVGVRDACQDIKLFGVTCEDGATHAAQTCCSPRSVSSITRSGTTATVTLGSAHGWVTGDVVTISGATQKEYNLRVAITVTGDTTFTYTLSGTPVTPATGTILAGMRPRNISWIGCTFRTPTGSLADGLIFHDADSSQAISCGFQETPFHDITSWDSSVMGCSFESRENVVMLALLDGSNRCVMVGNTFIGNGISANAGVVMVTSTSGFATHGLIFANNTVRHDSRGFQADPPAGVDCLGWIIRDNNFDTQSTPIRLRGQVVRALIAGNTIRRTPSGSPTGNGIDIADTCSACTIRDNDMSEIATQANRIVLAGSNPTTHILRDNPGYPTRVSGVVSVADGGTITHGLAATPTKYGVTATTSGEFASVTGAGATTLTVAIKKHDNTVGTTQNIAWWAEV